MSASFYELLKYAATGIASPDMTYYDRMRASTLMGGVVRTLTGQPPLTFKADGTPLISWSMKGNGSQTGTPTPDAPIMPEFVGTKTAQLLEYYLSASPYIGTSIVNDGGIGGSNSYRVWVAKVTAGDTYTISGQADVYAYYATEPKANETQAVGDTRHFVSSGSTITIPSGASYIGVRTKIDEFAMLNTGETALPYEPFGYKIPLTCAGQITPIYLGEVPTVRRVKKVDLGTLTYTKTGSGNFSATLGDGKVVGNSEIAPAICSHFKVVSANRYSSTPYALCAAINNQSVVSINKTGFEEMTESEFKSAMSGVLLWYALNAERTAIVNEPLAKIGDYADELSSEDASVTIQTAKGQNTLTVDTPIQPSKMTITFKG